MINRQKFIESLVSKLNSLPTPSKPKAVSVEKVILFIVDMLKKGNFRGIISVKIYDDEIYSPRIDQLEVIVESDYKYIDE